MRKYVNEKMKKCEISMKRIYISPATETMLMNPTSVLCASTPTGFGVENTPIDDTIIS